VLGYLSKRQGILEGVCITGGEPLMQAGIEDFLRRVKELGFLIKLDTNGSFPKKLKSLVAEGLVDYVAMDIKNSLNKYENRPTKNEC
jgi:pyruvate formate lyase activating enzyme